MEKINNLAIAALFDALDRNNVERELLVAGTELELSELQDLKKQHTWNDFLKMYNNLGRILGEEKAAREIAYTGIYNNKLSTLRAIATGFIDAKAVYWYFAKVACRHLFRDNVKFVYTKNKSNQVTMEVRIAPELESCPLLLQTYAYLFENVPTLLGLPKAKVKAVYTSHTGVYTVTMARTSYLRYYFSQLTRALTGYSNAVLMMEELESQSIQLSKLLDDKSELLRIISHDISNAVAVIDYNVSVVTKKGTLSDEDSANLKKAKNSASQLIEILRNVQRLEIAQLHGVRLEAINIDLVFLSVKNNFEQKLLAKNIELILENHLPFGTKIIAEKSSLELNVLSNLISNAIKFSDPGSRIQVSAELDGTQAVISVADEGRGIRPEMMETLFTKSLRKTTVGTSGEKGSGLGLGIVKYYMQQYNGEVAVSGNHPKGTVFKLILQAELPQFLSNSTTNTLQGNEELNLRN